MTRHETSSKLIVAKVLEQLGALSQAQGQGEQVAAARAQLDHLQSGELNTVICGECKRGKSSLIDAFIEEEDLCPADAPVATNVVCVLRRGDPERFVVHLGGDGGQVEQREIGRHEIRSYVTEQGNALNGRRATLLEIWLPTERLADGLVLMDTPGVGSLNPDHLAVTYGVIPYADAVLFVCSANEPLAQPELDFLRRIARHTSQILLVVSKRDTVGNWQEILDDNLRKVREVLDKPALDGVAVSSLLKLEYVRDGDEESLRESGFANLERHVWDLLARRLDIIVGRAAGWALAAIANLRLPARTERDALEARSEEELAAMDAELGAKIRRAEELLARQPFWVNELNRRTQNLRDESQLLLTREFRQLNKTLEGYLQVAAYVEDPKRLAAMLSVDCNNGFAIIARKAEHELGAILADLRQQTLLEHIEGGTAQLKPVTTFELSTPGKGSDGSWLAKTSSLGRSFSAHAMGLGTVGGLQAGAQLGAAAGSLIGGIFGIKRGINDLADKDLAALRQNLGPQCRDQLGAAQQTISHALGTLLTNARGQIHDSLLHEIQLEQAANVEARARLEKARHARRTEHSARLLTLTNQLKQLDALERTLAEQLGGATPA